jgi:hypothetical protein
MGEHIAGKEKMHWLTTFNQKSAWEETAFEIPKRRLENNIETGYREVGCGGINFIQPAQGRVQWRTSAITVTNVRFP